MINVKVQRKMKVMAGSVDCGLAFWQLLCFFFVVLGLVDHMARAQTQTSNGTTSLQLLLKEGLRIECFRRNPRRTMDFDLPHNFVLDSARDESRSRRKLEFEDDDAFLNMDVPMEDDGEQDESHNSDDLLGDINFVHSKISNEAIPKVDMKFMTEEAAYQFYNAYAYKVGFSVRRSKKHKDKSGRIVTRIFCCSCEGKRGKDKRDVIVKSHRPETRFGCLAGMKIKYCRETKQCYVAEFAHVHNHTVCTPSKTHLHSSHRKFNVAQAAQADMANDSGIAPKAIVEFLAREVGGRASLGFIPQDYKNYLRSERTLQMKVGDTSAVLEYLQKMQLEDPNFFHAIQVDEG